MQALTTFHHPQLQMLGYIHAGFPTAAEEELVDTLSLDQYLITNPAATFMLKASSDAMMGAGIHPGDLVIVERGRKPIDGDITLATVDGEWLIRYFQRRGASITLVAAHSNYSVIEPTMELTIAGVVVAMVRKYH